MKDKRPSGFARKMLAASALMGCLSLVSHAAAGTDVLGGYGQDVPLSFAVKQIVPPNYGIFFAEGVDTSKRISWVGGGTWAQVLDRTLSSEGLSAEIVGDRVIITGRASGNISHTQSRGYPSETETLRAPGLLVRPYTTIATDVVNPQPAPAVTVPPQRPVSVSPAPAPGYVDPFSPLPPGHHEQGVTSSPAQQPVQQSVADRDFVEPPAPTTAEPVQQAAVDPFSPAPVAYEVSSEGIPARSTHGGRVSSHNDAWTGSHSAKEWVVTAGLTLEEVLTDWAEEAGWSLVWDSEYDYPIEADAVFYGPFVAHDAKGGALSGAAVDLVRSMSKAPPRANADFYLKNRVVVITTSLDEHD